MKYFLDTEFLEGPQNPKWLILKSRLGRLMIGKPKPTIDIISIGIVAEDGREYYAISKDFNLKEAWNRFEKKKIFPIISTDIFGSPNGLYTYEPVYWIRENVLKSIWREMFFQADDCSGLSNKQTEAFYQGVLAGEYDNYFTFKSLKLLIGKYGKTNKKISDEIVKFCRDEVFVTKIEGKLVGSIDPVRGAPEFYAYFADYDWVVFCWLFGKMMDLPNGFPMYCNDLKQILDSKAKLVPVAYDVEMGLKSIKLSDGYPKQDPSKSHNAIEDARFNKQLYDFLKKL